MQLNFKKLGLIFGFFIICILFGYGIYALFFKTTTLPVNTISDSSKDSSGQLPKTPTNSSDNIITNNNKNGQLPNNESTPTVTTDKTAQGGITQANTINNNSTGSIINSNGVVQYYDQGDGKFYTVDRFGQKQTLSDKTFYNVQKVNWSPNKEKAILEYPDGANILYNFDTKKQSTLPKHWEDFNFAPSGNEIVAKSIGLDPDNRWLIISNDDGSQAQAIEKIGTNADKVIPSWSPNNLSVALFKESMDFDRQRIYFVGKNKENFKSMIVNGRGFEHQWDEVGEKMLYSVYSSDNNLNPELWMVDASGDKIGDNRKRLNVKTWASKCEFNNQEYIYCAVPNTLPEGAGVFPELANRTSDSIYKININTGVKKLVAIPDKEISINNIMVDKTENNLYFNNAQTQELHQIKLK